MKRSLLFTLAFIFASAAWAEDQTRGMQGELKKQGFYFGEVDGNAGPEFSAAVKRYQIRNGLEVTGQTNEETLGSLGLTGGSSPAAPKSPPAAPPRPAATVSRPAPTPEKPRVDLRRAETQAEGDRRALREEAPSALPPRDRSYVPPPADLDRPRPLGDPRYRDIFEATPFASAPPPLQQQTLRAAQRMMAGRGFYNGDVDGQPGPETETAVVEYQRTQRLRPSGRLDLETLNAMHLLPGPGTENPSLRPFTGPGRPSERHEYRGIWVR